MMHGKNVPTQFWAECMRTATYVINCLPQPKFNFMSPVEKLFGVKPNVSHLRVFGSVCYVFVPDHLRSKFEKKVVRCVFTGYDTERKGWRCVDPVTGRIHVSRNVVFDEGSSWWSSDHTTLPDGRELEIELQRKMNSDVMLEPVSEELVDPSVEETSNRSNSQQNPWRSVTNTKTSIVSVYVDDLIVTGDDSFEITRIRVNLGVRFQMKELGELRHFLGLEVIRSKEGIFLCQQSYAKKLLGRFGMTNCSDIATPVEVKAKLLQDEGEELEDKVMYRQLVGSLIYLTLTRPDIAHGVGVVSRFMQRPRRPHLDAIRRILSLSHSLSILICNELKLEIGYLVPQMKKCDQE
ncbi:hypothetical protein MRB53_004385 [Persea americana]|uniref:Uncharacterized protein n=1 Tax=Persea americana TaxID=3435 RepID=A0ACC2MAF3_PERAE|nr:hypothetical protein MRB53_004385 [Persea americana]